MTPKQEKVAEKLIQILKTDTRSKSIDVLIARKITPEEKREVKFYEQLIPILEDRDFIRRISKTYKLYELTEKGIDFVSFDKLREDEMKEQEHKDNKQLLTKKQIKQIDDAEIISKQAKRRAILSLIIAGVAVVFSALTFIFNLLGWI